MKKNLEVTWVLYCKTSLNLENANEHFVILQRIKAATFLT